MLSTLSVTFPGESLLGNAYTTFSSSFPPWEHVESQLFPCSSHQQVNDNTSQINYSLNPTCYHAGLDSGLDDQDQNKTDPDQSEPNQNNFKQSLELSRYSNSDDQNKNQTSSGSDGSGSDEMSRLASMMDERKRKRMISNRESARRSRWRKQRHLEDLRNMVNNLKIENKKQMNQLGFIIHRILLIRRENDRFRNESGVLQRRLMELARIWKLQQLQRNLSSSSSPSIPMHCHANI